MPPFAPTRSGPTSSGLTLPWGYLTRHRFSRPKCGPSFAHGMKGMLAASKADPQWVVRRWHAAARGAPWPRASLGPHQGLLIQRQGARLAERPPLPRQSRVSQIFLDGVPTADGGRSVSDASRVTVRRGSYRDSLQHMMSHLPASDRDSQCRLYIGTAGCAAAHAGAGRGVHPQRSASRRVLETAGTPQVPKQSSSSPVQAWQE